MTDDGLVEEKPHSFMGGVQRIYRWGDGGLSLINGKMAHAYPFAWEAGVLSFKGEPLGALTYETPLSSDVEVFQSDEEANEFIQKAKEYFTGVTSQERKETV